MLRKECLPLDCGFFEFCGILPDSVRQNCCAVCGISAKCAKFEKFAKFDEIREMLRENHNICPIASFITPPFITSPFITPRLLHPRLFGSNTCVVQRVA